MSLESRRWTVVAAATLGLVASQGPINVFAAGVFLKPLAQDLGFNRGQISTAIGIASLVSAVAMPLFGRLIDLKGVRVPLAVSVLLFALTTAALSQVSAHLVSLYGLFALVGLLGVGQNPGPYCKVISRWFDDRRGLVLGIALAGVGAGTAIIPFISDALIRTFGWRLGYVGLGGVILLLAFLPVVIFVREPRPQEQVEGTAQEGASAELPGLSMAQTARDWRFWSLFIAFFFAVVAINGTFVHVVPMLTDRGIPLPQAIVIISSAGLALIAGRLIAGWIIDWLFAPFVAIFFMICPLIGLAILALAPRDVPAEIGVLLLGLGIGAETDLLSYLISRYFGLRQFGTIYGWIFTGVLVGNAVGSGILGWAFEFLHSYTAALFGYCVLLAIAAILMGRLGAYRYPPPERVRAGHATPSGEVRAVGPST